ncbi:hypothetical protein Pcinc_035928 [Petrolisthes cinctipes]|uniref:Uncharacterized protein n=1 Tax=Petrolisthes cinctipes TaxID=88211 RepID=A0AAE1BZW7_PETCI|nr:hypothetical protein Pcinc_035928 [Petrolisthes cinctipes]
MHYSSSPPTPSTFHTLQDHLHHTPLLIITIINTINIPHHKTTTTHTPLLILTTNTIHHNPSPLLLLLFLTSLTTTTTHQRPPGPHNTPPLILLTPSPVRLCLLLKLIQVHTPI